MKKKAYFSEETANAIPVYTVAGIDIGSRQAKAILFEGDNFYTALLPTGFYMQETAEELLDILCTDSGIARNDIEYIVITGYGRVALKFDFVRYRQVTEIACHGMGAHILNANTRTIIDIGGQDSKAIKIDPADGKVVNFAMNEKCAAGTGRFLERISTVLGYDVKEIGSVSLEAQNATSIDSTCVVFAESEVVSKRAKGISPNEIAAGIHRSVASRVNGLLNKVGIESGVLFTGGVSNNVGMKKAFEDILDVKILDSKLDTVFAGALGAAAYAAFYAEKNLPTLVKEQEGYVPRIDLNSYHDAIEKAFNRYIDKSNSRKKAAYTCTYTPIEVLAAADVDFIRLYNRGTPEEVIAGESLTQSMLCDHTKSLVGGFMKGLPEYAATDKLYTFYTCGCMKNTVEAINRDYVAAEVFNVPRTKEDETALKFLEEEINAFKRELENFTGVPITEEKIRETSRLYNKAKSLLRVIFSFRKKDYPVITGEDAQTLMKGYFVLPVEKLINELEKIKAQLKLIETPAGKKIRVLLAGGIVADGDDKMTRILEKDLGVSVVAEDNCTGLKPISENVNVNKENIYEALAEEYLNKAPCGRMAPIQDMVEYSAKVAREYDVDGVVLYYLKFCPCYSLVEKAYADKFKKINIPLIIISGDYSRGDEGQVKTRLEAFVELLQERESN